MFNKRKKNVEEILSGFTAVVAELEQLSQEQSDLAAEKTAQAAELQLQAVQFNAEADRATAAAAKIRKVFVV